MRARRKKRCYTITIRAHNYEALCFALCFALRAVRRDAAACPPAYAERQLACWFDRGACRVASLHARRRHGGCRERQAVPRIRPARRMRLPPVVGRKHCTLVQSAGDVGLVWSPILPPSEPLVTLALSSSTCDRSFIRPFSTSTVASSLCPHTAARLPMPMLRRRRTAVAPSLSDASLRVSGPQAPSWTSGSG